MLCSIANHNDWKDILYFDVKRNIFERKTKSSFNSGTYTYKNNILTLYWYNWKTVDKLISVDSVNFANEYFVLNITNSKLPYTANIYNNVNELNIYICIGNHKIKYMYEPIITTIIHGFKHILPTSHVQLIFDIKNNDIKENSIFVFVGIVNLDSVPWKILKSKNIYNIYYQTEPISSIYIDTTYIDVIWDYSFNNIEKYETMLNNTHIRYIPCAYSKKEPINYKSKNHVKLIFFGKVFDDRISFWKYLKASSSLLKNNLEEIYNIWNENVFENFLKKKFVGVFINIHKNQNIHKTLDYPLESFRISKLLNSKILILSTRCNEKDEEMYRDLVTFCDTDQIENEYKLLLNMSPLKRQELADNRYNIFKNRFSIKTIFENVKFNNIEINNNYVCQSHIVVHIRGEMFRMGPQNSTLVSYDIENINKQYKCFESIIEHVIKPIECRNLSYSIIIYTYENPELKNVDSFFKKHTFAKQIHIFTIKKQKTTTQSSMWNCGLAECLSLNPNNILVVRADTVIKQNIMELIEDHNSYYYGFRIGNHFQHGPSHLTPKKNTRISDTIQWIPKQFFYTTRIFPSHNFFDHFPEMKDKAKFMIDTYGDTDSSKCQNDLHYFNYRPFSDYKSSKHLV